MGVKESKEKKKGGLLLLEVEDNWDLIGGEVSGGDGKGGINGCKIVVSDYGGMVRGRKGGLAVTGRGRALMELQKRHVEDIMDV